MNKMACTKLGEFLAGVDLDTERVYVLQPTEVGWIRVPVECLPYSRQLETAIWALIFGDPANYTWFITEQ